MLLLTNQSQSSLALTISEDEDSVAHGSIHDGVFEGVISYQNETYHLEPSHKYYESPEKHSLIYRASDVDINPQLVYNLKSYQLIVGKVIHRKVLLICSLDINSSQFCLMVKILQELPMN